MAKKNRKGKGREYGQKFKANQIKSAQNRVFSGHGTDSDFDTVFDQFNKKLKR